MRLFDYATSPVGDINAMRADGAFSHSKSNLTVYALGAAFFLLLASVFGYELWIERQRIQQTAEAKAQAIARMLEEHVVSTFTEVSLLLRGAASTYRAQPIPLDRQSRALHEWLRRTDGYLTAVDLVMIGNQQGEIIARSDQFPASATTLSDQNHFQTLRDAEEDEPWSVGPFPSDVDGKERLVVAFRLGEPDGSFAGVLIAGVAFSHFQNFFASLDLGENGFASLRTRDRTLFATHASAAQDFFKQPVPEPEILNRLRRGDRLGTFHNPGQTVDGVARVISFREIPGFALVVSVGLAAQDYLAPWRGDLYRKAIFNALLLLLVAIVTWRVAASVRQLNAVQEELRREPENLARAKDTTILRRAPEAKLLALNSRPTDVVLASELTVKDLIEAIEQEQLRIGQELHDGLGQHLTGIAFLAKVLERKLQDAGLRESDDAAWITRLVNEGVGQTRALARGLRPVGPEENALYSALKELANDMTKVYGITCRVVADEPVLLADANIANHLYRIVQEAVNNALKHGQARTVEVELSVDARCWLTVRIWNDGHVPDAEALASDSGLGLSGMRYRARLIGAELAVDADPDCGVSVTVHLPLPQQDSVEQKPT